MGTGYHPVSVGACGVWFTVSNSKQVYKMNVSGASESVPL